MEHENARVLQRASVGGLFLKSKMGADILEALMGEGVELISLDVFDTVAFRSFSDPNDVFIKVGKLARDRKILSAVDPALYQRIRINAARIARKETGKEEVTLSEIAPHLGFDASTAEALVRIEEEVEAKSVFMAPFAKDLMEAIRGFEKKIVFTSDMYLTKQQIQRIALRDLNADGDYEEIFVSGDYGRGKASGGLFEIMFGLMGVSGRNVVHIGDNALTDVVGARTAGCRHKHFSPGKGLESQLQIEKDFGVELPPGQDAARRLAAMLNPYDDDRRQYFFQLGATIWGPLLNGFAAWMLKEAAAQGIDTILAVTREGGVFVEALEFESSRTKRKVEARVFSGSRRATFLASLSEDTIKDQLLDLFNSYRFTVRSFLEDLWLSDHIDEFSGFLDLKVSSSLDVVVNGRTLGKNLVDLVQANLGRVVESIDGARKLLREYLLDRLGSSNRFAFCDFGGGGTFPLQMRRAVPDRKSVNNFLFYAHASAERKWGEASFQSFIPVGKKFNRTIAAIKRSPEVCEVPLIGNKGSVVGYGRNVDGVVVPIEEDVSGSARTLDSALCDAFRAGIDAYYSVVLEVAGRSSFEPIDGEVAASLLYRQIQFPTAAEARHLGDMIYDDNFGSRKGYKVVDQRHLELVREKGVANFWRENSSQPSRYLREMPWPQGVVTQIDRTWLLDNFGYRSSYANDEGVDLLCELVSKSGIDEAVVYGAGVFFEKLLPRVLELGVNVTSVVDRRAEMGQFEVCGFRVKTIDQAFEADVRNIIVASAAYCDEIRTRIADFSAQRGVVVNVLCLD